MIFKKNFFTLRKTRKNFFFKNFKYRVKMPDFGYAPENLKERSKWWLNKKR
jgi:hypothetical protein